MKKEYQIPLIEVISMFEIMDPVCGVSGGEYSGTGPGSGDGYDPDSD
ncbi:MAG: hypothetical protein IK045_05740 [Bacteroidales bacterium]|nr:hypothetical protein [Bacteroidales bacterium]